ncbi:hypothetical protein GPZ77_34450 (plasmid) [Streptomyces sp. QHH-9511]|uniref:hypothetical protein n=1 Tax=Streptomyces sp. QHH-9511 TaxID=2684468 RepID=UPI0013186099|nr:hypothetical protein [Streptomyces sp. QHH-9511]QGZ53333.1 hypothetical protein GPZ77_34450 [Streptomyces sp. QHH-9511]
MDATLTKPSLPSYRPADGYVTLVLKPGQVELGDITDHSTGPVRVTEITERTQTWSIGGYAPDDWRRPLMNDFSPPPLMRHVPAWCKVRVYRRLEETRRVAGHSKVVKSHNPVRRGCYTHVQGWNASCSCGWVSPSNPHNSQDRARKALIPHHAEVLTKQTLAAVRNLARVMALEEAMGEQLPWAWRNGVATADLTPLGVDKARPQLERWADALGAPVLGRYQGTLLSTFSPSDGPESASAGVSVELQVPDASVPDVWREPAAGVGGR